MPVRSLQERQGSKQRKRQHEETEIMKGEENFKRIKFIFQKAKKMSHTHENRTECFVKQKKHLFIDKKRKIKIITNENSIDRLEIKVEEIA